MSISSSVTSDRKYDMSPEVDSVKPPKAGIERISEIGFEQSPEVGIQKNKEVGNKWLLEVLKYSPPEEGNKIPPEVGSEMPLERGSEVPMEVLRGLKTYKSKTSEVSISLPGQEDVFVCRLKDKSYVKMKTYQVQKKKLVKLKMFLGWFSGTGMTRIRIRIVYW